MAKPVHSMIRVLDETKSLDFYARAFGLEVADHLKFADFALIYLRHPSSPFEVELNLDKVVPDKYKLHAHHWLILHGRYTCLARKPRCEVCLINDLCRWPEKTV